MDSIEKLTSQRRLAEFGLKLLKEQPSLEAVWEHSGYSGIFIEKFLEASVRDTQLVVKCEFPHDDDADTNIGYIYISLDDQNKFVAEF